MRRLRIAPSALGADFDPAFREKVLGDLAKLPAAALEKLSQDGWSIEMTDFKIDKGRVKAGGDCNPRNHKLRLDREVYGADKGGRTLLHELGHALDFRGFDAPKGLLAKLAGGVGLKAGMIMESNLDPAMSLTYAKFQAQNLGHLGHQVLLKRDSSSADGGGLGFTAPFHGQGSAGVSGEQLVVQVDARTSADQSGMLSRDAKGLAPTGPLTMDVNGVSLTMVRDKEKSVVLAPVAQADKLTITWTPAADYIGTSNLPAELYAEGVSAYFSNNQSREALKKESPDVFHYVQASMEEYFIADHRR